MAGSYTSVSVSADSKTMVSSYDNASRPAEIVRIAPNAAALTHFNDSAVAALDMQTPETFWTTTSRGKKIRSMLVKPAGFDASKKYPLYVVMHGGPAGAWKDTWDTAGTITCWRLPVCYCTHRLYRLHRIWREIFAGYIG